MMSEHTKVEAWEEGYRAELIEQLRKEFAKMAGEWNKVSPYLLRDAADLLEQDKEKYNRLYREFQAIINRTKRPTISMDGLLPHGGGPPRDRFSLEAIQYIVEWDKSGNEDRSDQFDLNDPIWRELDDGGALTDIPHVHLSPAGLTISALARALFK